MDLNLLGWDAVFAASFAPHAAEGLQPARVAIAHNNLYTLFAADGEWLATVSGRLKHTAHGSGEMPAVGDWVAMRPHAEDRTARIQAILPRRTKFSRKIPDRPTEEQVIAANVDTAFLVSDLMRDFNVRRVERYLTLARQSGAQAVIVLTKCDLCADPEAVVRDLAAVAAGAPVHVISNLTGRGIAELHPYIAPGRTIALLGSSGVGKSSLINRFLGEERLAVADVREDGKGRHTTTHRELILLAGGGLVIDNPGMRELHLWDSAEGMRDAFDDIAELAAACRFTDCRHEHEPGCAVLAAVADGRMAASRHESYIKLQHERAALEALQQEHARRGRKREAKTAERSMKSWRKTHHKR